MNPMSALAKKDDCIKGRTISYDLSDHFVSIMMEREDREGGEVHERCDDSRMTIDSSFSLHKDIG